MRKLISLIAVVALFATGCSVFRTNTKTGTERKNWHDMTQDQIRSLPLEEVVAQLRHEYDSLECPKKTDRMHIPEDVWQKIDWTQEEIDRNAALPHKMWNMRHDDHLWPGCHEFRGDDAFGYRAGEGHEKYFPRLPKLVKGSGIARWLSAGDKKAIEIPLFADYEKEWTEESIPETLEVVNRKCGDATYGSTFTITKADLLAEYGPSPLQKWSLKSWLETYPKHISYHRIINKNEDYCGKPNGPDDVYFYRSGWRWDSLDEYFVKGAKYIGGRWN